tara:strand:+ start:272 stop:628 length:357 start_codon:yes stop_codon:yes gene_type:complete
MDKKEYCGGCHCGKIRFRFFSDEDVEIWKCNCSICELLNYEHLFVKHEDFKIIQGNNFLSGYSFGTKKAKHLFCQKCGIKSFYQPRSHPDSYSINLKCVDNAPEIKNVVYFNGKNEFN